MSAVDSNQPLGTPTWINLTVPDLDRAQAFYRAVLGWDFDGDHCRYHDVPVAGLRQSADPRPGWTVHLATDDCDATAKAIVATGGKLLDQPHDDGDRARIAVAEDPTGARFGLWQGRSLPGCRLVNEPNTLMRNDLVTPVPAPAREFYCAVFGFSLDGNDNLPGVDFTFLRRPDGHEIGGILGNPSATAPTWGTLFLSDDADAAAERATTKGGEVISAEDSPYGRMVTIRDPFGTELVLGS
ncbi:VOC family protein [Amycolatopsis jejuensis]|uniref:VOC family protein n=1 Tax=Amycolatopsis jejuensis TaxID=330084 RepID=UPI00052664F7|nr:VOC family protein [Amycolatopsis jejuensis]